MIQLKVNGESRSFEGDPQMPLLWYLRDKLELTGTKFGCGMALCGACTVHLNGRAVRSCSTPMSSVGGQRNRHDRSHFPERPASRSAEMDRIQRSPVRLLPDRDRSCRRSRF